jgi:hypothetical protein
MIGLPIKDWNLDDFTKALGALAIGGYVLGYLVLSHHLSSYGFSPTSPFRARVLETGICTLMFFAMPVFIAFAVGSFRRRGTSHLYMLTIKTLSLPILCATISNYPGFMVGLPKKISLSLPSGSKWLILIKLLVIPVVLLGLYLLWRLAGWIWANYHKKKMLCIVALLPVSTAFFVFGVFLVDAQIQTRSFFWLLCWSFIVLVMGGEVIEDYGQRWVNARIDKIKKNIDRVDKLLGELGSQIQLFPPQYDPRQALERIKQESFEMLAEYDSHTSNFHKIGFLVSFSPLLMLVLFFIAISAYVNWIFPYVPFKLGGGEIMPVTIYEVRANQSPRTIHAKMLDQSDQGYVIVLDGDDRGYFIPKERIEAIYFSDNVSKLLE